MFPKCGHGHGACHTSLESLFLCLTTISGKKPPMVQLCTIAMCPATAYEQDEHCPAHFPFSGSCREQWGWQSSSFSPKLLLIGHFFQHFHRLCCHPEAHASTFTSFSNAGSQSCTQVPQVRLHQLWIQQDNHVPWQAGDAVFEAVQDGVCPFGTMLTHTEPAVSQHAQVPFNWAAHQPLLSKSILVHSIDISYFTTVPCLLLKKVAKVSVNKHFNAGVMVRWQIWHLKICEV